MVSTWISQRTTTADLVQPKIQNELNEVSEPQIQFRERDLRGPTIRTREDDALAGTRIRTRTRLSLLAILPLARNRKRQPSGVQELRDVVRGARTPAHVPGVTIRV